jgi:hypothetical protein
MPSRDVPTHDRALFDALVAHMRVTEPELRIGSMFGCPQLFLGGDWHFAFSVQRSG